MTSSDLSGLALASEAHLLGELGTGGRIIRRHHRVARVQTPLLTILVRRQAVVSHEVSLKRLELLPVLKTDDVIVMHGTLRIDCRLLLVGWRCLGSATDPA